MEDNTNTKDEQDFWSLFHSYLSDEYSPQEVNEIHNRFLGVSEYFVLLVQNMFSTVKSWNLDDLEDVCSLLNSKFCVC